MAAPEGNKNASKGKQWRDAINKALKMYEDDNVQRGHALRKIAENMVKAAIEGDKDARREIGDRLDGKPHQSTEITGDPDKPLITKVIQEIVDAKDAGPS